MVQFITTYRYDYTPPITDRYKFKEKSNIQNEFPNACDCNKLISNAEKSNTQTEESSKKTNLKMEWTGIAPMGRINTPKLLPPDSDGHLGRSQQTTTGKCIEGQPNRFLKVLEKCYPDLYERLKQMPDNELKRRLNVERLKTTYQIDYCKMPEFPTGIYHQKVLEEKDSKSKNTTMIDEDCEKFKEDVQIKLDVEKENSKCENRSFRLKKSDLEPTIKDYGNNWAVNTEFTNKPHITEYVDKVCRTGCIVMKNNIHDHRNCGDGQKCVHDLKTLCKDFK